MKLRRPLTKQIIKAWHNCITKDYSDQRINSERSLQASFWSRLNSSLSKNKRMFIEPNITFKTNKGMRRIIPDLVICNTKEVIRVIELKYGPRAKPKYAKDIRNLSRIAKHRADITISNARYQGVTVDGKRYCLSDNILFVLAGVHAASNHKIISG